LKALTYPTVSLPLIEPIRQEFFGHLTSIPVVLAEGVPPGNSHVSNTVSWMLIPSLSVLPH